MSMHLISYREKKKEKKILVMHVDAKFKYIKIAMKL